MASIGNDPNGTRRVLFVAGDGRRKTIRLGDVPLRTAESIRLRVEDLLNASIHGQAMSRETANWLPGIGDTLHGRLAKAGLVQPREKAAAAKLGEFIDGYLAQRPDVKAGTMIVFRQAQRHLVRFLGETRDVAKVTPADADAYRAHLLGEARAKATVNKWCQYARHFFEVARRRRLIAENPFAHIKGAVRGNTARRVFVSAADVQLVIDAAPDPQWKLLIALGRWGGLRIPSEALALTWRDVDFEHQRFTVRASKTEHHAEGGIRVVPMFPELAAHFQRVFDEAEPGTEHVITRYRDPAGNLRTQLCRYIEAAGLTAWAKPWQNMRASRATELADAFPSHVCAAWLGHTEAVADEFYRSVTDSHFERAIGAAHKAAQSGQETGRKASQGETADHEKTPVLQGFASGCKNVQSAGMGLG